MQHIIGIAVLDRPHDSVPCFVRRNTGRTARIGERRRALRDGRGRKPGLGKLELKQVVPLRGEVNTSRKVGWHGPDSSRQNAVDLLVDGIVIVGVELPHVAAIYDVDVSVLASSDGQGTRSALGILLYGQE